MIGARIWRRNQGEDQIDRFIVDGAEFYGRSKTYENPPHPIQPFNHRMGNGDAMTDPGGAEGLTFHQGVEKGRDLQTKVARRKLGGEREGLALAGGGDT